MYSLGARLALPLAALLLVAGCGSEEPSSPGKSGSDVPVKVGQCPVDSPAVSSARTVATADLDGDGRDETVKLTGPDGDCPDLLFARLGEAYVSAQLEVDGPPLTTAFAVEVPGGDGALLVTRQDHPRGGFQLRVYVADDGKLVELNVDDHPLVPFVALDVEEHPMSVDCADGGVVLTEAVAHEPVGVMFAWDVKRTSYAIDGTGVTPGVTAGPTEEIADNVLPKQLRSKYPDLVRHAMFTSCRAAG